MGSKESLQFSGNMLVRLVYKGWGVLASSDCQFDIV